MANPAQAVAENVPGDFFVDTTCIDCGTCRHVAPQSFAEANDYSYVYRQPAGVDAETEALRALLACPTGSIGTRQRHDLTPVRDSFPLPVTAGVYYNGFTSPKSYGASSYFIQHPDGNWLVDSPKFLPGLVAKFRAMGGVRFIFLTHSDDVGDADRFAAEFGAERIIHREELWSQPAAERMLEGEQPTDLGADFRVIPVPGHTRGSCCLLFQGRVLFTGDHMWWDPDAQALANPEHYFWDRARMQTSNQALLGYPAIEWILPGHGAPVHLPAAQMQQALQRRVMESAERVSR